MRRVAVRVPAADAEPARAVFVELFPDGFEEREQTDVLELAAYTDGPGEARIRKAFGSVTASKVEPGWEKRWRDFHRPVRIGPLWIGPGWEAPPSGSLAVVIEPARAFGTGAHPTTRSCVELLVELRSEFAGGASLLDIGCGSGVLAIAATRLGYGPVAAVDTEAEAIAETRRNALVNGVEIETWVADALRDELPSADVAVANIARATIEELAARLRCHILVASGYLESDTLRLRGFRQRARRVAEGWAADLYERDLSARSRDTRV